MAARADEKLREIMDDKKEPEEKEEDMTKQRTCKHLSKTSKTLTQANSPEDVYCKSCVDKIEKYINCDMAITEKTYITDKPRKQ